MFHAVSRSTYTFLAILIILFFVCFFFLPNFFQLSVFCDLNLITINYYMQQHFKYRTLNMYIKGVSVNKVLIECTNCRFQSFQPYNVYSTVFHNVCHSTCTFLAKLIIVFLFLFAFFFFCLQKK
jgi:hypothetical protein